MTAQMNTVQTSVLKAVERVAAGAWSAYWTGRGVRLRGSMRLNKGRVCEIVFDDPEICEGARWVGSRGGGTSTDAIVSAAIAAADPARARELIAGYVDEDERAELTYAAFSEE